MAQLRDRIIRPYIPWVTSAPYQRIDRMPRDGSPKLTRLVLTGAVDVSDPGGGAAGTVKTTPVSPAGAIANISEERSPGSFAPVKEVPPYMFHYLGIPLLRRIPGITALSSGAAATYTLLLEMFIPRSLGNDPRTFLNGRGLDARSLVVKWPSNGALADLRDALLTSSTMTWAINASDPLRVEVSEVDAIGADLPLPAVEIGYHYDKFTIAATGINVFTPTVRAGERPLLHVISVKNNSARADLIGGVNNSIKYQYGSGGPVIERPAAILQRENQQAYGIPQASWYTGLYFLDIFELAGRRLDQIPPVGIAAPPTIVLDTASTAPTATADVEILTLTTAVTAGAR